MEPRRRCSFRVFCLLISLAFSGNVHITSMYREHGFCLNFLIFGATDVGYSRKTKEYYLQAFKHPRKTPAIPPYCVYRPSPAPTPPPPLHGGTMPGLWCVAKPTVPDPIIQEAMDYACGAGAECESIRPGRSCYQPNTLLAHASFAFNSYWQRTKVAGGTCDFQGAAILITVDPSKSTVEYATCYNGYAIDCKFMVWMMCRLWRVLF